jgi:acyl-ACP thioesterase
VTTDDMAARGDGRQVRMPQVVRLGDVTPRRRVRLDALARYLQDVAGDDATDAALPGGGGWIMRRLDLDVARLPQLGERLEVVTSCTGVGGRWAERTTTLTDGLGEVTVTGRAVWVYVDLRTGAPRPLPAEFFAAYGEGVRARKVSARLTLPVLDAGAPRFAWPLRSSDFDVFEHVNNASYWVTVEHRLTAIGSRARIRRAEIEYGAGIATGEECEVAERIEAQTCTWWFLAGGDVRATARVELRAVEVPDA